MLRFLFELLFWASAEGLLHVAVHAGQRKDVDTEGATTVVDANGTTVVPGLIDSHVHVAHSQPSPYNWKNRSDDPVYKKNLQRLIERNRQFEESKE